MTPKSNVDFLGERLQYLVLGIRPPSYFLKIVVMKWLLSSWVLCPIDFNSNPKGNENRVDGEPKWHESLQQKTNSLLRISSGKPKASHDFVTRILWAFPIVKLRLIVGFKL